MTVITRFAPSPTGLLHIGNVRTALINWLFTKKMNGKFMLRMDDTDLVRSKAKYAAQIEQDLKWLGLEWEIFAKQSDRLKRYEEVKQQLINSERLYPCFETQEELEVKRKMQLSRGKPPIYDRAALKLSKEEIENNIAQGKVPHYRFKMNDSTIFWHDMIRGENSFAGSNLSDPIVIREDNSMTYILCSVIDDIDYNITHIIRGEDHVSNTAIQVQIFEALNAKIPQFGHLALIKTKEVEMSKRVGGFDIKSLRDKSIDPLAISTLLAKLGTSDSINSKSSLNELVEEFDISKFGRAPANYDEQELLNLNHKILNYLDFPSIKLRLEELKLNEISEEFWTAIKNNINTLDEVKIWWNICYQDIAIIAENNELISIAVKLLPQEPWDSNTWKNWTQAIANETGLKGKNLFMPLRKMLTAKEHGPDLNLLLPLIGRSRVVRRLNG